VQFVSEGSKSTGINAPKTREAACPNAAAIGPGRDPALALLGSLRQHEMGDGWRELTVCEGLWTKGYGVWGIQARLVIQQVSVAEFKLSFNLFNCIYANIY